MSAGILIHVISDKYSVNNFIIKQTGFEKTERIFFMREKYESLSLATLKDLAKARGLKGISTLRKPELIERMLQEDEKESPVERQK